MVQPDQIAFLSIDWPAFHDWLDRWAPLAEWAVAAGTIGLAIATYAVARSARAEAQAVSTEATQLTEQAQASLRAYVYPESTAEWAWGAREWAEGFRDRVLPLRNGGPGVALNVGGHVDRGTEGERIELYAGSIAPGHTINARPARQIEGGWGSWDGTWHGELRFGDLNDDHWITHFTITVGAGGGQIVVQHEPPERFEDAMRESRPDPDLQVNDV
jgi:hypothetical protein